MRSSRRPKALAIVVAAATLLCVLLVVVLDRLLRDAGRADLTPFDVEAIPYLVTIATATGTGVVVALRRPTHPVGWLFLALGASIALGGVFDSYGRYGTLARPGNVPAAELAAVLGDGIFIAWFVLIALILHLTPTTAQSDRGVSCRIPRGKRSCVYPPGSRAVSAYRARTEARGQCQR